MKMKGKKGILLTLLCAGMVVMMVSCSNGDDDSSSSPVPTTETYTGSFTVAGASYDTLIMSSDGTYTMTVNGVAADNGRYEPLSGETYTFTSSVHNNGTFTVTKGIGGTTITLASGSGSGGLSASGSGTRLDASSGSSSSGGGNGSGVNGTGSSSNIYNSADFKQVIVNSTTFQMGCAAESTNTNPSTPVHSVTLTRSFVMCDHEVTQGEWKAVMGSLPSNITGDAVGDNKAVSYVTWYAAIAYCNKVSIREGLDPCYTVAGVDNWETLSYSDIPTMTTDSTVRTQWNGATCDFTKNGYRLPTEAEWEYAARAGNTTTDAKVWSGTADENLVGIYACYEISSVQSVKTNQPNALDLYDMSGNVWEWCWDLIDDYPASAVTDPTGGTDTVRNRIVRGGSYCNNVNDCTVSYRTSSQAWSGSGYGYRVVRTSSGN